MMFVRVLSTPDGYCSLSEQSNRKTFKEFSGL